MPNQRHVVPNPNGGWTNKKAGAKQATSNHPTQKEAEAAARRQLAAAGGGELVTHGEDGRIRSKDTIAPGNDPNPPRDREH